MLPEIVQWSRFSVGASFCLGDRFVWPKGGSVVALKISTQWNDCLLKSGGDWLFESESRWMSEWVTEWGREQITRSQADSGEATVISIDPILQTPGLSLWLLHWPLRQEGCWIISLDASLHRLIIYVVQYKELVYLRLKCMIFQQLFALSRRPPPHPPPPSPSSPSKGKVFLKIPFGGQTPGAFQNSLIWNISS